MFSEAAVESESGAMAMGEYAGARGGCAEWQTVDRALRTIAARRAALDADEARWLREAEAMGIWRRFGMVSALDYMERVLGYAPRAAQERLRVARALGALPGISEGLASGELSFSAVRELTRVATPMTELEWRAAAVGKNLRQIEELVADHRPGDRPGDPKDPEVRMRVVRVELSAETFALWRQARQALDEVHGTRVSDDEALAAMCSGVLEGTPADAADGRARFQIAVTICERCRQGWQEGAGAQIAIGRAAVERAQCDAQHIGSINGAVPERAYQDVAPSVRRLVQRRDGGRCCVPGCRSARGLELHHLVHRADDGSHHAANLIQCCSACHQAHHDGTLTISGTPDRLEVRRAGERDVLVSSGSTAGAGGTLPIAWRADAGEDAIAGQRACVGAADAAMSGRGARVGAAEAAITGPGAHMGGAKAAITGPGAHMGAARAAITGSGAHMGAAKAAIAGPSARVGAAKAAIAGPSAHMGEEQEMVGDAEKALVGLGWPGATARAAVAAAARSLADDRSTTLERFIVEALRRCPRPRA